jgi:hypothetical protein
VPIGQDYSTFCVLPFYGREYPGDVACCLLDKTADIADIKSDMLAGIRPNACTKCWTLEDAGIKSDRQIKNETLDFYANTDLAKLFEQCQYGEYSVIHYKIDTSNTCNSTCITCGSFSSSLWGQLEQRHTGKYFKTWKIRPEKVDTWINYAQAKVMSFRGGEPLLSDTNFHILEKLIEAGNTTCCISFVTNGSVKLSSRQQDIINQFSNVNVSFSIDGVGKVFEYLRYPLVWNDILENINWCRTHGHMISASYTVSNLNVLYYTETCNWFDQEQIPYIINPVYQPAHFSVRALPEEIKNQLKLQITDSNVLDMLVTHTAQDDIDYKRFQREIQKQDTWKGIKMQAYLPELMKLLG